MCAFCYSFIFLLIVCRVQKFVGRKNATWHFHIFVYLKHIGFLIVLLSQNPNVNLNSSSFFRNYLWIFNDKCLFLSRRDTTSFLYFFLTTHPISVKGHCLPLNSFETFWTCIYLEFYEAPLKMQIELTAHEFRRFKKLRENKTKSRRNSRITFHCVLIDFKTPFYLSNWNDLDFYLQFFLMIFYNYSKQLDFGELNWKVNTFLV